MPGGDKTGPMGQGSRTGRGLGNCPALKGTESETSSELGRGRGGIGRGMGRGRGLGPGRGFGPNGINNPKGDNA